MTSFIIALVVSFFVFWIMEVCMRGFTRFRRPIINRTEWKWQPVSTLPLLNNQNEYEEILVTDGEDVINIVLGSAMLTYNSKGQRIFGYKKKVMTHWSYLPSPPEK